jgi:acetoin utilization deacetylase AcuC-like enzyme
MSPQVGVYSHSQCMRHETSPWHPENPQRLASVLGALRRAAFNAALDWREAPEASRADLLGAHSEAHVRGIEAIAPTHCLVWLDPDTAMGPETLAAARRAVGAAVTATSAVLDGELDRAFCAVRPPGHHAERSRAMGFCFFNNIACAAAHALARGVSRVAILDFDVHHGNGTEDIFRDDCRVLFCSSFQHPFYPLRPLAARDHLVHVPLSAGAGSAEFRAGLEQRWWPAIDAFEPELILISAGFDAHVDDPMAELSLLDDDYRWATERIVVLAERFACGRVVSMLEGGYDPAALARCTVAHVAALACIPGARNPA